MISYDTIISSDLQNAARHLETAAQSLGLTAIWLQKWAKLLKLSSINYKHVYIPHSHIGKNKSEALVNGNILKYTITVISIF